MEHREAQELLPAYLDQELDIMAILALERHLADCPDCQQQYAQQTAMSARIRKDAGYFNAPARLAQRIDDALPRGRMRSAWPRNWKFNWFSIGAATMTFAAAAWSIGLYLHMPSASERLAEEVVAGHIRSLQVDHLADVASSDQHTVKPWFNGKIDFAPPVVNLAQQGFPLIGGRLDVLNERPVAALVYRRRQHPINLYISPSGAKDAPAVALDRHGYHLVHWAAQGMDYWAVSDLAASELAQFAQLLRADREPN